MRHVCTAFYTKTFGTEVGAGDRENSKNPITSKMWRSGFCLFSTSLRFLTFFIHNLQV
jgi:hypothetical protein